MDKNTAAHEKGAHTMKKQAYSAIVETYQKSLESDGKSRNTVDSYLRTLRMYGNFCDGKDLDPADPGSIVEYKAHLRWRGNKSSSIALAMTHIKCFFDFAAAIKAIDATPYTPAIAKVKKEQRKPYNKLISEHEFLQIVAGKRPKGMHDDVFLRNKAILVVFLTSAIRNSELRFLRVNDCDFLNGNIAVHNGKGGKQRTVLFPAIAQKCVKDYLKSGYRDPKLGNDAYLFGVNSADGWRQLGRTELSDIVRRAICEYTGVDGVRSHALRHTSASIMRTNGMSIDSISEFLGHENVQTTRIYAEWLDGATQTQAGNAIFDSMAYRT